MRQLMRQSAPDLASTAYPERKISCMGNPFFNVDPMASHRRAIEATRRALSPADSVARILNMTQPRVDPVADHHRRMEALERALFPSQGIDQILRFVQPIDAIGARKVLDPMSEYRRITGRFSALTGVDPSRFTAASPVDNQVAGSEGHHYSPNLGLIVNLLGIAWVCGWLLARGADVERVGGLMLAAVALAVFLAEKNRDT